MSAMSAAKHAIRTGGRARSASFAALALFAPRAAEACAVCVSSRDDGTQLGFLIGTLIMTPLPFLVVGSLICSTRWKRLNASRASGSTASPPMKSSARRSSSFRRESPSIRAARAWISARFNVPPRSRSRRAASSSAACEAGGLPEKNL